MASSAASFMSISGATASKKPVGVSQGAREDAQSSSMNAASSRMMTSPPCPRSLRRVSSPQ